jgi:hypothetical protein
MSTLNQAFLYYGLMVTVVCGNFSSAFAQDKLSPHFKSDALTTIMDKRMLSVSVKDTLLFKKTYGTKIRISKIHRNSKCIFFTVNDAHVLRDLKDDLNVLFVDTKRSPHTEGDFDWVNPSINKINQVRNAYPDLNGAGYSISIKEENFIDDNIDLKGRTFKTSVTPATVSQHATTMAILIGGAGNSSSLTHGVVNRASVTSSDFNNLMPDANILFINNNILIQNHSYGVGIENYYGNEAFAYDQQVSNNPNQFHVFSSGNVGNIKPSTGTYKDLTFANLTGTFKQGKNVLVISAIDTTLQVNELNSRGPAYDGRLKPELTAYGPAGTSEAAALTTGIATLIQEKYKLKNNQQPDMALIKAILIASANDIGAKGIDFITGYGNINAYQALRLIDQNQLFQATLSQQDQISFPITVSSGVSQLKVAICWIDPPANVNSSVALVNDIDSWVDNGSAIFQPWVLSSFPLVDSLTALAKRKPDHLNNVEFITIDNPAPGTYQLVLNSETLTGVSQKVSVAYSMDNAADFSWTYPVASDIVQGGAKNFLGWEAQTTERGDLYVQINSGEWQLISEKINLQTPFKWNIPDMLAKAKLKMSINAVEFLSDEFMISPLLELKTAFNCTDSLGLAWNKITNATSYEVFALGDRYLEPIQTTNDTVIVFNKPSSTYFAVLPKLNQAIGMKSAAIDYSAQGSFCFLNFFSASRISALEIEIKMALSSLHNIDHINILKTVNGVETILKTFVPDQLNYSISDFTLKGGITIYQAQIVFKNSSVLLSDAVELTIEGKGKVVIWPNPVTSNDYLNIISDGDATFRILSQVGEIVYEKKLTLLEDELDIDALPSGLYFYQILNGKTTTDTGRIIKL